ncbi:NB-ARC domain-containing protein [Wolbachia endosymbiont of Cantharis cryptica]|uniref:NB-ARC domain-containing protein n=1 Tax=Wolbachia endosymbiont of Cantharis cryptica TaxID=3066132 RepID=UPI00376EAEEB
MQENKDFIKREVGREVSDKEIEDFLNKLVFAVNLPNEIELGELIKNEIGQEFNNIDRQNVYSRFLEEVLDWMKAEEGKFLSYEEIRDFFEKVREEIFGAVWFGIIEPVASFTGRGGVLTALHNVLQRSAKKQAVISQVASISGLGGVGKSELARKYAYKYGKDYYGNVIWISAENSKTMENSFLDLAEDDKLGISPQDKYGNDKTIETIVKETYAFFARRRRKSLFIFDNAEGYKDISKFLPSSLDNKPYILITSRNKDWGISEDEGEIKTIQLGVFKETEALKFVKRALNIRDNLQDEEIKKLTQELQYFPLALKQAAAYINEKNVVLSYRGKEKIGVSDYLKRYEEEAKKLLDFELKNKSDRYTKTTFVTWKITIDAIAQKECGFEALSVLEIVAYLAPDKIRIEEIFSKLIADDEEKLWNAVKLLDRYSMVDLKEGVANIHRLVQKVIEFTKGRSGRRSSQESSGIDKRW